MATGDIVLRILWEVESDSERGRGHDVPAVQCRLEFIRCMQAVLSESQKPRLWKTLLLFTLQGVFTTEPNSDKYSHYLANKIFSNILGQYISFMLLSTY